MPEITRRSGLGGSEIAAVLGMSPHKSAYDVYLQKRGLLDDVIQETNERMWAGKKLEQAIASMYQERSGNFVAWSDELKQNPKRPWQIWTPDFYVWRDGARAFGGDSKNVAFDQWAHWGREQSEVPDWIAIQCCWYMSAEDFDQWDIGALFGGHDFRIYTVRRDRETESMLLEVGEQFWQDCVIGGAEPTIVSTDTAKAYLKKRFPRGNGVMREPTPDERALIMEYARAREAAKAAETLKDNLEIRIKAAIGEDDGFNLGKLGKVTYKRTVDSTGVLWEPMARWAAAQEDLRAYMARFTGVTREGARKIHFGLKEK